MDPFQDAQDPWSGKALGEATKPRGFDDFWTEQEAVQRGEKEPDAHLKENEAERGKGAKSKGGTGGKGRGRRRYNVVERPPRARPTHFVAIRLFSRLWPGKQVVRDALSLTTELGVLPRIRRTVQQMQQWFIAKNPLFEHCLVPVRQFVGGIGHRA